MVPGAMGDADLGRDAPRLDLVAEDADGVRWPNPDESGVEHGLGEVGVLGEEPVAGVDGVGRCAFLGDGDDRVDVEIGLRRRGAGQRVCLVGEPDELSAFASASA